MRPSENRLIYETKETTYEVDKTALECKEWQKSVKRDIKGMTGRGRQCCDVK